MKNLKAKYTWNAQDYIDNLTAWFGYLPAMILYRLINDLPERGTHEYWQLPNHTGIAQDHGLQWTDYWTVINRMCDLLLITKERHKKIRKELIRVNFENIMDLADRRPWTWRVFIQRIFKMK